MKRRITVRSLVIVLPARPCYRSRRAPRRSSTSRWSTASATKGSRIRRSRISSSTSAMSTRPRLPDSPQYVKAGEWVVGQGQGARAGQRRHGALRDVRPQLGAPEVLRRHDRAPVHADHRLSQGLDARARTASSRARPSCIQPKTLADLDKYKGKLKDAIVLLQGEQDLPISFDPMASRLLEHRPREAHAGPRAGRPPAR